MPSPPPKKPAKPTLKDVANEAEVSVATVSMALADHPEIGTQTKQRVREVSQRLGYRPRRRAPETPRAARLGYLQVGGRADDLVHASLLRCLSREAARQGARLEVSDIESADEPAAVTRQALAFAEGLDAVMLSGLVAPQTLREVARRGVTCLVIGHVMGGPDETADLPGHLIYSDDLEAGVVATRHLIAAGHQRVAFTCEATPVGLSHWRWLRGYNLAHLDADLPVDPALIQVSGRLFSGAAEAVQAYLALDAPPTAHVVPDVRIAASLIQAYAAQGIAVGPERLVIGGSMAVARMFHVEHYPLLGRDNEAAAEAIIARLLELHRHPPSRPTALVIPFERHNFPQPAEGAGR